MQNDDCMTNYGYCLSLTRNELPLVNRVIRTFINKTVGEDAPVWEKERAYKEWCGRKYSEDSIAWETARREMLMSTQVHSGLMDFKF